MIGRRRRKLLLHHYLIILVSIVLREEEVWTLTIHLILLLDSTAVIKEGTTASAAPSTVTTMPDIPPWGTEDSYKRVETEPVATFQISRNAYSTEIVFDPPMYLSPQPFHFPDP